MINKHKLWSRVFTYIPTPTADDGESVDENALRQVIDYQVEMGVDGICVLGSCLEKKTPPPASPSSTT